VEEPISPQVLQQGGVPEAQQQQPRADVQRVEALEVEERRRPLGQPELLLAVGGGQTQDALRHRGDGHVRRLAKPDAEHADLLMYVCDVVVLAVEQGREE